MVALFIKTGLISKFCWLCSNSDALEDEISNYPQGLVLVLVEQMIIALLWALTSGVADYEHHLLAMRKLISFFLVQQGMIY
jgi:hypothetical protein